MKRLLAIDFGLKRTGIAETDDLGLIATPLETVDSRELIAYLKKMSSKNSYATFVLGEPKTLQNQDTHISENVRILKEVLIKEFPQIEIVTYDERFTSKMALQSMITAGANKKQRSDKGNIDKISACILLNSYLDSMKS